MVKARFKKLIYRRKVLKVNHIIYILIALILMFVLQ